MSWLQRSLQSGMQTAVRPRRRVLVVALALVAACAPASAVAAKQTSYSDYANLLAPAMLLAHGDWEVRGSLPGCQCAELQSGPACLPP